MEPQAGRVEQHFGSSEAAYGGLSFQGYVHGDFHRDVHIHRKLSTQRPAACPTTEPIYPVDPG